MSTVELIDGLRAMQGVLQFHREGAAEWEDVPSVKPEVGMAYTEPGCCSRCIALNGANKCRFPLHVRAPHIIEVGGAPAFDDVADWPSNFTPDEPQKSVSDPHGTYTHCLNCGRSRA